MPRPHTLSVIIPCFNEAATLKCCVERVCAIADASLSIEIIIVDDASTDGTSAIAKNLAQADARIRVMSHSVNSGKGAALHTGFAAATQEFVAVQDADLEYNPQDLKKLLMPLVEGDADVVFGSRFISGEAHRVLYFWHSVGNRLLTLLSNMFTDLNLTDMETGYKVFKREIIQSLPLRETRFGFEPEVVAQIAHRRLKVYEAGISYNGRSYQEGKKIGLKDAIRALYCIVRYNAPHAPMVLQFFAYLFIGGAAALVNLILFILLFQAGHLPLTIATPVAFAGAALVNYLLCVVTIFRHKTRWNTPMELFLFWVVVGAVGVFDMATTIFCINTLGVSSVAAKLIATAAGLVLNFAGRRIIIFPEKSRGDWK